MMLRAVLPCLLAGCLIAMTACNKSGPPGGGAKTTAGLAVKKEAGYDVHRLTADLKSATTAEKRARVLQRVTELDEDGENVVPALLDALKDSTAGPLGRSSERPNSTRETAVIALLGLKDKGKKALQDTGLKTLESGLRHKDANVREHTVNAIGLIGPDAKASADAVTKLCTDREKEVRGAAYRTLQKIKTVPPGPIIRLLNHPNVEIATEAAAALTWLKVTGPENVAPLLDAVKRQPREKDEPSDIRFIQNAAAEALAGIGKDAESAVTELVELIKKAKIEDLERMIRPQRAGEKGGGFTGPVLALRRIGKPAAASMIPLLKHDEATVRYQAAAVLNGMAQSDAAEALPQVQAAMDAERGLPTGQMYVFEELAACALHLGGDVERITAVVIDLLKSDEEGVRYRAAVMLGRIGRKAAPAVPKLTELLNDPNDKVQAAAVEALAAIGPAAKDAVIELAKKVESDDVNIGRAAARALRGFGPLAAPAVPALCKALESNDQNFCIDAAQAIAAVGPEAVGAVESIAKQLNNPNSRREERLALLHAVTAIGPAAKDAIAAVSKLVDDRGDASVRAAAVETLAIIGPGNAEALKKLGAALKDSQMTVRVAALRGLAGMGAKAQPAATAVKELFDSTKDSSVRVSAAATLVALGSNADTNAKIVLEALKDKAQSARPARVAAIDSIEYLGAKARPGVPELIEALKDKSPSGRAGGGQVRERAARALGKLGAPANAAIRPLTDALKDSDRAMRQAAAEALGLMGPDAVVAVPKLRELLRTDPELSATAQAALDRIEPVKTKE